MLLLLRRLSGQLPRAVSVSASADVLLPLRRLPGLLRRSLSTAASPPPCAMLFRFSSTPNSTPYASFPLAPPPSATVFSLPKRAFDYAPIPDPRYTNIHGSVIFSASGDGLLLLKTYRVRLSSRAAGGLDMNRFTEEDAKVVAEEAIEEQNVRYVCNPVTGQLVRLPDYFGMEKHLKTAAGLVTQADGGHGPPTRYAAVELHELIDEGRFVLSQFSSETGKWNPAVAVHPSPLQPGRKYMCFNHEVLAVGGRLWWVDVSWGAVSTDPFSDQRELRHVKLPGDSILPPQSHKEIGDLIKYRRMGVSDGRLRYVEVSKEAPFQINSFVLDDDESGRWTLEHQVSLDALWPNGGNDAKERPLIGAIDPLNADLLYLNMGCQAIVSVDMRRNRIIDQSSLLSNGIQPSYCGTNAFLPCVLPSFLGSSPIPGKTDAPKQQTLADVLVRSDKC